MRRLVQAVVVLVVAACLSSCFLVSIPVKAAGEMIEQGAQATGAAMNRGIHKVTRPDRGAGTRQDDWKDDGGDDYVEDDLEHLPPLLPRR